MKIIIVCIILFVLYLIFIKTWDKKERGTKSRSSTSPRKQSNTNTGPWHVSRCNDGTLVRSKAEKILADVFAKKKIDFIYEKDLFINGRKVGNPDFYLPAYDCYVEYFWMMANPNYKKNALFKMNSFRQNNILCADIYPEDITEYTKGGKKFYSSEKLEKNLQRLLKRRYEKRLNILHTGW